MLIALLVLVVAAGAAVGIVLATKSKGNSNAGGGNPSSSSSGGSTSQQASADYTALLARLPQSVRGSCKDISSKVADSAKPFVQVLSECQTTVNGTGVTIDYRTLKGDAETIKNYRTTHLGLGGVHHSPGDCQNFLSTDPTHNGTVGFAEAVNSPPLVGTVWCDTTGTMWYLQMAPASGNLPTMTTVLIHGTVPAAQQRYRNLEAVAPTS